MDFLVQGYKYPDSINEFEFNHRSIPPFSKQNLVNGLKPSHQPISDHHHEFSIPPNGPSPNDLVESSGMSSEVDSPEESVLKYISQMLMEEEDLEHQPCMLKDCLALQAVEKPLYDALGQKYRPLSDNQHPSFVLDQNADSPIDHFTRSYSSYGTNSSTVVDNFFESNWFRDQDKLESSFIPSSRVDREFGSFLNSFGSSNIFSDAVDGPFDSLVTPFYVPDSVSIENQLVSQFKSGYPKHSQNPDAELNEKDLKNERDHSPNGLRGKKNHYREDNDSVEGGRCNKQLASYLGESDEESEMYDMALHCPLNSHLHNVCALGPESDDGALKNGLPKRSSGGRPRGGKKQGNTIKEMVDLRTLLAQCAQAVSSNDIRSTNELLNRIRQHSSPYGDGIERLAHFFANALEARLAGSGTTMYTAYASTGISAADLLKSYQVLIKACPYQLLSEFFANELIRKLLSEKTTRLHIIDFGILYGFQWPCLIMRLSVRPGGPPKLRITGIELPQPGFRPVERVEATGRRLAKCCEKFKVPFEYNAIAKKWETIQLEDLKVDKDEVLVVNCLYRLRHVPDDTVAASSPRDTVLNLIKSINPDLFVHGVLNGTYNAPFFLTRFREALFHFSAQFDMFEATMPREDQDRMMMEKEIFGRDVMNVIACEGSERVEKPETYKQWQVRNLRAGFRQLPLDREIVEEVRGMVRRGYNRDFVVDEDRNWMLQGWKGRVICAVSCWRPAKEF